MKNHSGQLQISEKLDLTLVFSIWGTFSSRGKGSVISLNRLAFGVGILPSKWCLFKLAYSTPEQFAMEAMAHL